jgi:hypothetical protein
MTREPGGAPEPWELQLRQGLDGLAAGLKEEAPPDLGALLMLAQSVQAEQRRAFLRDLAGFAALAVVVLAGSLYGLSQFRLHYLMAQWILGAALLVGVLVWPARGGMSHE